MADEDKRPEEEKAEDQSTSEEKSTEERETSAEAAKQGEAAMLESDERSTLASKEHASAKAGDGGEGYGDSSHLDREHANEDEEGHAKDQRAGEQTAQRDLVGHTEQGSPASREKKKERAETDEHALEVDDAQGHGPTGHGDDHFAHVMPMKILLGVLLALVLLTILTVAVTAVDLGSQGNFVVAMIIATVKAGLVMAYFMHLVWDSKFNVLAFLSSFLFVLLFLSITLLDRQEYQMDINMFEADTVQE